MIARRLLLSSLVLTAGLGLAGCTTAVAGHGTLAAGDFASASPTPVADVDDATPATVVTRAFDALSRAGSVEVHGGFMDHGASVKIDLLIGADPTSYGDFDGQATLVLSGLTVTERQIGKQAWMSAPAAFWTASGLSAASAKTVGGKWVLVPEDVTGDALVTNPAGLAGFLQPDNRDAFATAGTSSEGGTDLVSIRDSTDGNTYVCQTGGVPLLHEIRTPSGRLAITYPGTRVTVEAPDPATVVDLPGS